VPIGLLGFWQIISVFHFASPLFVPAPISVFFSLTDSLAQGALLIDITHTLSRVLLSFFLAVILGVPLGLLMGYSTRAYDLLEFPIEFFRSIPPSALFPFFLLIFGIGEQTKIAVTVWGSGLVILIHSLYGVHLGKKLRLRVAKTLKIRGFQLFRHIIFFEALPQIFSGFRIAISIALMLVIITEMFIGTDTGLGGRIIDAQLIYRTADMYAAIILTGIIGFLLNRIVLTFETRIVHWKGR
jgi:NitT/TauT family transport system permease protein